MSLMDQLGQDRSILVKMFKIGSFCGQMTPKAKFYGNWSNKIFSKGF